MEFKTVVKIVGRFTLWTDEESKRLQSLIFRTSSVKVNGITGNFVEESVLAFFQVFPALYNEVVGLTINDVFLVIESFDISASSNAFAKAVITIEYLDILVNKGYLRKEKNLNDENVYFPTERYLIYAGII